MTETLPAAPVGGPQPEGFDLVGPLPTGTTVLEASAGTGKTYAITALAVVWHGVEGVESRRLWHRLPATCWVTRQSAAGTQGARGQLARFPHRGP